MNEKTAQTVQALGEFPLIEHLAGLLKASVPQGSLGIGDDCAVLPFSIGGVLTSLLITTDTMVEGKHFRFDYTSASDLGRKLLAVNLSDIAACGGKPIAAVVTLQLPRSIESEKIAKLYEGIAALAQEHSVSIVGGDTTSATELAIGMTVLGVSHFQPALRSSARVGDEVWVSGRIGGGGLGLRLLRGELTPAEFQDRGAGVKQRYNTPSPRLGLGKALVKAGLVNAMMDISDGLIQDAGHIAKQSQVQLRINIDTVPVYPTLSQQLAPLQLCCDGDDYELLFTSPSGRHIEIQALGESMIGSSGLTCIGRVEAGVGVSLEYRGLSARPASVVLSEFGIASGGFRHF